MMWGYSAEQTHPCRGPDKLGHWRQLARCCPISRALRSSDVATPTGDSVQRDLDGPVCTQAGGGRQGCWVSAGGGVISPGRGRRHICGGPSAGQPGFCQPHTRRCERPSSSGRLALNYRLAAAAAELSKRNSRISSILQSLTLRRLGVTIRAGPVVLRPLPLYSQVWFEAHP